MNAYEVEYQYIDQGCPNACVNISGPEDCVSENAEKIKKILVDARGGSWESKDISIKSIRYIGPFFDELDLK